MPWLLGRTPYLATLTLFCAHYTLCAIRCNALNTIMHCTTRATIVHSHSLLRTLHNALYSTHCTMYYTMHCTQRVTTVHCTNCGGCYWLYSLLALSALFKCSLQLWPLLGHSLMPLHHCSELHCCSGSCLATFNLFLQLQCIALTVVA